MFASKRRPTSSLKNSQRCKTESSSTIQLLKRVPTSSELMIRKYYYPGIHQQQRHLGFLLSKFVAGTHEGDSGFHGSDPLQLGELTRFYCQFQCMQRVYQKAGGLLKRLVSEQTEFENNGSAQINHPILHFGALTYQLLVENRRRKREWINKKSFAKKESQRSTDICSKKEINILGTHSDIVPKEKPVLNESHELSKLSKCLKNVLKKHDTKKTYKAFLEEMEKKKSGRESEKSEGLLKLILNLEKDFSSIHQEVEQLADFSKESIYGLSDLKKKSERNASKIEVQKGKDKRLSTNFAICRLDFGKKLKESDKSNKGNSTSKTSQKSSSVRNKKGNGTSNTPDNHNHKSKSKNSKKTTVKAATDKKSKLSDTERLYFDEAPEKMEEKQEGKSAYLKDTLRKSEYDTTKSKKKLLKR